MLARLGEDAVDRQWWRNAGDRGVSLVWFGGSSSTLVNDDTRIQLGEGAMAASRVANAPKRSTGASGN